MYFCVYGEQNDMERKRNSLTDFVFSGWFFSLVALMRAAACEYFIHWQKFAFHTDLKSIANTFIPIPMIYAHRSVCLLFVRSNSTYGFGTLHKLHKQRKHPRAKFEFSQRVSNRLNCFSEWNSIQFWCRTWKFAIIKFCTVSSIYFIRKSTNKRYHAIKPDNLWSASIPFKDAQNNDFAICDKGFVSCTIEFIFCFV